jgi:hypothetical protein
VPLPTYRLFAAEDQLTAVVMERMLAGLATRRHTAAAEPVGHDVEETASATSRSAVSRRFVAQTKTALAHLLARDLTALDVKVLMIDGEHISDQCCVVALAITADGTKVPVGLWEGSTENKTVATHLLSDLVSRGLDAEDGMLVVIDGAKALSAAVTAVFGASAAIQRCTVHKRRNVTEHLPESERARVDLKLVRALNNPDAAAGLRDAKALATALERNHPRRGRVAARGPARAVHRGPPRDHGHSREDVDQLKSRRVHDLDRPHDEPERHPLARRADGAALDRRRHAQRPTLVPPRQGPQADAPTRRRATPLSGLRRPVSRSPGFDAVDLEQDVPGVGASSSFGGSGGCSPVGGARADGLAPIAAGHEPRRGPGCARLTTGRLAPTPETTARRPWRALGLGLDAAGRDQEAQQVADGLRRQAPFVGDEQCPSEPLGCDGRLGGATLE